MRISSTIKERLQQNADRMQEILDQDTTLTPVQRIQMEYLEEEAEAFRAILNTLEQNRWRNFFNWRNWVFWVALLGLSTYVVFVFQMFKNLDLTRVEPWEFVVTALPFWLLMAMIPVTALFMIFKRKRR
jgi:hypothetical protein